MYHTLGIHRAMLRDHPRNEAYRQALLAHIKPHHVVLDVGAGSGILSMFAAQAGAARVYAVERTSIAHLARRLIAKNNFANCIHVIESDIEIAVLPEKVDVIVSEWLGTIGVDENLLAAVTTARNRWLKPGGVMLPEKVTAMIAPAYVPSLDEETNFWRSRPYNLDLSLIGAGAAQEYTWTNGAKVIEAKDKSTARRVNGSNNNHDSNSNYDGNDSYKSNNNYDRVAPQLLSVRQPMWTTDAYRVSLHEAQLPARTSLRFRATRDGICNAFIAWFIADFGAGITLSTALDAAPTHWRQYVYPLNGGVAVKRRTDIAIEVACLPFIPGYSHQAWSARIGNRSNAWEHHDTRRVVWME